jgi:aldehyde dehydrogenase (NAD+)
MIEKRQFYIDGAWVDALQATDSEVIGPASEEPVAVIALGSQADTHAAVTGAKAEFGALRNSSK